VNLIGQKKLTIARIAAMPHKPGQEAFWAKLEEQRARRAAQKQ